MSAGSRQCALPRLALPRGTRHRMGRTWVRVAVMLRVAVFVAGGDRVTDLVAAAEEVAVIGGVAEELAVELAVELADAEELTEAVLEGVADTDDVGDSWDCSGGGGGGGGGRRGRRHVCVAVREQTQPKNTRTTQPRLKDGVPAFAVGARRALRGRRAQREQENRPSDQPLPPAARPSGAAAQTPLPSIHNATAHATSRREQPARGAAPRRSTERRTRREQGIEREGACRNSRETPHQPRAVLGLQVPASCLSVEALNTRRPGRAAWAGAAAGGVRSSV